MREKNDQKKRKKNTLKKKEILNGCRYRNVIVKMLFNIWRQQQQKQRTSQNSITDEQFKQQ